MLILTREDILKVFSMRDAIEADKKAFVLHTEGRAVVPLRINIDNEARDGQIMFMPAYVGGGLNAGGVKIVSCFTGNREKGLPVIPATMAVVDGDTGVVSAILDGTTLTQLRTAAISGAAIELLANPDASVGALFGTGGQAPAQLEALMTVRKLSEVRVYDALEKIGLMWSERESAVYTDGDYAGTDPVKDFREISEPIFDTIITMDETEIRAAYEAEVE